MKHKQEIRLPMRTMRLGETSPKPQVLSRQAIRRLGYFEILLALKKRFPNTPRQELRHVARIYQKAAWNERDQQAIRRLTHPNV